MNGEFKPLPDIPFEAVTIKKSRDAKGYMQHNRSERKLKAIGNRRDINPTELELKIIPESPMQPFPFYVVPASHVENAKGVQLPRCKYEIFKRMRDGREYPIGQGWWNKRQSDGSEFIKCTWTNVAAYTDIRGKLILRQTKVKAKDFSANNRKPVVADEVKNYQSAADDYLPIKEEIPTSLEEAEYMQKRFSNASV